MFENIEPKRVFYYFEELSKIPRCSNDEKKISDYIKNVGESLNLETIQDENLNVIIRKSASPGYENSEGVIIQGHMDMVCEKEDESDHDFKTDPIQLIVDGDFIHANMTTLGADNGIAVAMGLAILEDNTLEHPNLELLVTASEETDMGGALGLSDKILKGKRLLNLDTEEEGVLVAGSAGGELIKVSIESQYEEVKNYKEIIIEVKGLQGGHSGSEIHKPIGNAIKLLTEILKELKKSIDIKLVSISGGTKDNAIPRQAMAKIAIKSSYIEKFNTIIVEIRDKILEVNKSNEPEMQIMITTGDMASRIFKDNVFQTLLALLDNIPTGVNTWLPDNREIVESSSNLAIVQEENDKLIMQISTRSSKEDVLLKLRDRIIDEVNKYKAHYSISDKYPEWEFKPESRLRNIAVELYEEMYGKDMEVAVIHAGLECGVFAKKYDLDIISFGPNMYDVHTPKERLSISSTKRSYEYLVKLLKRLK